MDTQSILDIVLREMRKYGDAWRENWSDFDGRTLRSQLSGLAAWAEAANSRNVVTQPTVEAEEDYREGTTFYEGHVNGQWDDE